MHHFGFEITVNTKTAYNYLKLSTAEGLNDEKRTICNCVLNKLHFVYLVIKACCKNRGSKSKRERTFLTPKMLTMKTLVAIVNEKTYYLYFFCSKLNSILLVIHLHND